CQHQTFGNIFLGYFLGRPAVMVSGAEGVQQMLTHPQITAPGELNELARPLLGANSLTLLSEPEHQARRKLLTPPFHGERLWSYGQWIREITQTEIARWTPGQAFEVRTAMQDITLRVILKAVFGLRDGSRLETLKKSLVERFEMTAKGFGSSFIFLPFLRQDWGPWSPWGRIVRKQRNCDALIYAEIAERRANPDPERIDILNLLLSAVDEAGEGLTDVELRDELMTLLFAGHETTATSLTWALYLIHQHPSVYETLMAELATLGANPDPIALYKLPYLTAVCNETLRLYNPALLTFGRRTEAPVSLLGQEIPAGTVLAGSIYLTHRDPQIYPQPEQFRPERFLEQNFSPYEFIPFGGGSRRCIGMALAQMEMKLVLATILLGVKLEHRSPAAPLKPQRRGALLGMESGFTMAPLSGAEASVSPEYSVTTAT
ncbi:MAG: cytochrome P450, partial [Cyanobacteriota bacterium]